MATLVASVLSLSLVTSVALAGVGTGDRAPDLVAAKDDRGRKVKLKQYRDKVLVLTFGASWCQPCKKELPAWEKLAVRYADKGVVFMAVNIDKEQDKGKAFIKTAKLKTMRAVFEPDGGTVESYDPPSMPTTYVIDRRGVVRFVHAGYRGGDEAKLAKELDALLGK